MKKVALIIGFVLVLVAVAQAQVDSLATAQRRMVIASQYKAKVEAMKQMLLPGDTLAISLTGLGTMQRAVGRELVIKIKLTPAQKALIDSVLNDLSQKCNDELKKAKGAMPSRL